jgi:hypothetical protein
VTDEAEVPTAALETLPLPGLRRLLARSVLDRVRPSPGRQRMPLAVLVLAQTVSPLNVTLERQKPATAFEALPLLGSRRPPTTRGAGDLIWRLYRHRREYYVRL